MALVGLGVSGGIGAYKSVEVARLLQKRGHRVRAILTRHAAKFVGPLTFEAITRAPVITSQFKPGMNADIEHIALASDMNLLLVAPATANVLAKFAHGIADDFLSALYLATKAPVLVAPAMNTHMWEHPATAANIAVLRDRGVTLVEPGDGYLACGWVGKGRLAEPDAIADAADRLLTAGGSLAGRHVVVTAGPTLEDIDPVRFLANRSSGRMGFALAAEASRRGASVTLISGPTSVTPPAVSERIQVRTAREMHQAVLAAAERADVVIMAAAVADYTLKAGAAPEKLDHRDRLTLELERTPDILADLGARRGPRTSPVLIGFAAQTGDPVPAAMRKLADKHVDLIVANDVTQAGAGFDVGTNIVTLVSAAGSEPQPLMAKTAVAAIVLDRAERLLQPHPRLAASR
ncbi:MAG TPA: bifunctional phosphopantothenoylcysteine decarboxylase/phosphopantothenate--cysteine ligase CoaBC [Vicinamibacterales bacterium]|nr:bifunctional phosphopantothenoylcysteine decarboxylase/phosphopantothenate--cysteine ligase CoaBC [Vicinamibacterales bacterium]